MTADVADERPARILIVDDDRLTRRLLRRAVESVGYVVTEAEDGERALAALDPFLPDVILMDILMPRMNGLDACSAIRALPRARHIPVVMLTALEDEDSINQAYEAGAATFATKPINYLDLVYRLRYIVRSKLVADRLRDREAQLAYAQRIARLGYWEWHAGREAASVSAGAREIFDLPLDKVHLGFGEFIRLVHAADRAGVKRTIVRSIRGGHDFDMEYRIVVRGGERVIHHENRYVPSGSGGQRLIGICQDISQRRRAESRIRFLASFDPITGLPNRALFKELLEHTLADARRHQRLIALMWIDIDRFKQINDTIGYDGGDRVLREVGQRLLQRLRRSDHVLRGDEAGEPGDGAFAVGEDAVSRLGGDEFMVLLNAIRRPEDGALAAERVEELLREPFDIDGQEIRVTASVGIAVHPMDGGHADALLNNAEIAMYHAKERGRNGYQFFTAALNQRAARRASVEAMLRRALVRDRFVLHYQPQIDLRQRRIVGVEALLRLRTEDGGIMPPDAFVPVAEESGLIVPIGEWVMAEAARQAAAWRAEGLPDLRMAINLSPVQFRSPNFVRRVEAILLAGGIDFRQVEFELTESHLFDNIDASVATLHELAALGIKIAVDDFGTGYSSLTYLRRFPISAVKVDRSFVRDVVDDADDAAIVDAVIALAHSLRLRVVAEGVEHPDQLAFLLSRNCEEGQGFLFSRPRAAEQVRPWIETAAWHTREPWPSDAALRHRA
jgi:predicted signal transduction protein with EAL and GGDEF domain/FixJ family two-component response regulator